MGALVLRRLRVRGLKPVHSTLVTPTNNVATVANRANTNGSVLLDTVQLVSNNPSSNNHMSIKTGRT